jgi:hypothetical protein
MRTFKLQLREWHTTRDFILFCKYYCYLDIYLVILTPYSENVEVTRVGYHCIAAFKL